MSRLRLLLALESRRVLSLRLLLLLLLLSRQAGRQAGLSESSYNCYVPYA